MIPLVKRIGRAVVETAMFARHTATGLLLFLGALGVLSPIAGWAYLWLTREVNLLALPEFWHSPFRGLIGLAVVGLLFVPLEVIVALFAFSGTREHALFIFATVLGLILWIAGMVRLRRATTRRRRSAGRPDPGEGSPSSARSEEMVEDQLLDPSGGDRPRRQ